jgi:hypothetical protein
MAFDSAVCQASVDRQDNPARTANQSEKKYGLFHYKSLNPRNCFNAGIG